MECTCKGGTYWYVNRESNKGCSIQPRAMFNTTIVQHITTLSKDGYYI